MPKYVGTVGVGSDTQVSVHTMTWWMIVLVRAGRVYIQAFLGLLLGDGIGAIELSGADTGAWLHVMSVGWVATLPTFVSLLQNLLEFLTKIDVRQPGWRA